MSRRIHSYEVNCRSAGDKLCYCIPVSYFKMFGNINGEIVPVNSNWANSVRPKDFPRVMGVKPGKLAQWRKLHKSRLTAPAELK
jgi:hypothetical protein